MSKVKSFTDLKNLKSEYHKKQIFGTPAESLVQIKVGMATCGIASGAKEIKKFLIEECEHQAIDAEIKQTGCLGYCYAEPMVEVQLPDSEPVVFGYVDKKRAKSIIENYIIQGEEIEGEIPISFKTIND
ncbi:MAG: (2Fe-2S) ferredoxin domain-containing protein [Prolixibacteraceae bacterium]|jgi:NADP-reducing hydrogenase subunit HndB|nr:(2Fe-2S) ferredoxin domain-containing protein [Prolixibacteraceae bacterium]MBT6766261.1 (2Fe-2S) ferredoxin domain-containing protein [Prolixibacteraceae bacterium]MBT6998786.1 (2Fe-2S) ferredoxin domain-containing protein [Prolixibacteraceae bacterium]MBT7396521.1 (2Fe-2S) ferredoxin domain-containing protein [Prolixibacteraceae bacterium]